ncbi:hypothetical protein [Arthrobacter sp. P2b]|uniref:hypothetical protein n=1 Tax=Arthrobacter sp. P2b TaxID=1938741 RepID=UPI0009A79D66|nr:hypothetical protein [Arthrobacter sp. P2b]SLK00114.1 hypothetical protein SAMN06272721_10331 [Arthrobacter sp. P2b]
MEPHHQYPHNPAQHPAAQVQVPPLPAWAKVFRTILLVVAGLLMVMLLLLFLAGTSASADMYTPGGTDVLQATIWLGLGTVVMTVPYLIASIIYAILWAAKLRGRGYRGYPATWALIAGPVVVALPIVALIGLISVHPSTL